jgi:hypothetical protein
LTAIAARFPNGLPPRVDGSSVIGNGTGLSFSGGGALLTYGNNAVNANGANGAFSGGGRAAITEKKQGRGRLSWRPLSYPSQTHTGPDPR